MIKQGMFRLTVAMIATACTAMVFGALSAGSAAAASQAPAYTAAPVAASMPMTTTNRCVNTTHTVPCWATTLRATTLYKSSGGTVLLGGNDLVYISCYYESGSTVYDHVTQENGGNLNDTGHINDTDVNLDNHNPWKLPSSPNIPVCG
jgi:hypothetical protein